MRWWRERVRYKPYRPIVEWLLLGWCGLVGWMGGSVRHLWRWARRLPAPPPLDQIPKQHILCVRPDGVGDMVLLTPALMALRACYPAARVTLLTSLRSRQMMAAHPAVNDIVNIRGDQLIDLWHDRAVLRRLRARHFDIILIFESVWSCGLLGRWLRATARVGYDIQGMGFLFTHAIPYPYRRKKTHQVTVNARLVEALGCAAAATPGPLNIPVEASACARAQQWLADQGLNDGKPLVMIHPGSRARYVRWQPARFGAVAERVTRELPAHVLVLCGPGEAPLIADMLRQVSSAPPVIAGWSLTDVAGLVSCCQVFLGNSTGTTQFAAALGPSTIMLIGGTHPLDCPERWAPWGNPRHRVVHKDPVETIGRPTSHWLGAEGLDHLTPDDVFLVVRDALNQRAAGGAA